MIDEGAREQEAHIADFAVGLLGTSGVPFTLDSVRPIGSIEAWAGASPFPPSGWLVCNGQTVNRVDYPALYQVLAYNTIVTISIASPAVITWTGHGLAANTPVIFYTDGALPTGITAGTIYYIKAPLTDSFNISATPGGANINTSGTQSGNHTGVFAPWGDGDGVNTFVLPDLRGRVPAGLDAGAGRLVNSKALDTINGVDGTMLGNSGGNEAHQITIPQLAAHSHRYGSAVISNTNNTGAVDRISVGSANDTGTTGADKFHNNVQPTLVIQYLIWAGA